MDDDDYIPEFEDPPADADPRAYADRLIALPEFEHLRDGEARLVFVMRTFPLIRNGKQELGSCHLPTVQGKLKDVFNWMLRTRFGFMPDFVIVLCQRYWSEASDLDRQILVHHEMLHCGQKVDAYGSPKFTMEGKPEWCIRAHCVEEFQEIVERYGAHDEALRAMVDAANKADKRPAGNGIQIAI